MDFNSNLMVGVCGAGAMGSGIAQVAAMAGHKVLLYDTRSEAAAKGIDAIKTLLKKLEEKQKIQPGSADTISSNLKAVSSLDHFKDCGLVIEAIVEKLDVKQELFNKLEAIVKSDTILASNTSSLSVTAIAGACKNPLRVIGIHFFNPAPLMPLVEIIPAVQTDVSLSLSLKNLMLQWKKVPVIAKDTPGFIVNRVARPFYSEALRMVEEQIASYATIDAAMKELGFRMGPFELMDLIGNDVNYAVTETVWTQCYFDPRYKPSIIQKRMVESGRFGRKTGQGYYSYDVNAPSQEVDLSPELKKQIQQRILSMLINEAADALHFGIAGREDIDLAMTKGVNYPKGLLAWCDEIGAEKIVTTLDELYERYHEDRYRTSVTLRDALKYNQLFYA